MTVTVEWQGKGIAGLIAAIKQVPEAVQREADTAIDGVADGMVSAVKAQYRRGRTGTLQRGVRKRKLAPLAYQVRSAAPHAHLYEFGTRQRQTKRGANRGAMPRFGPIFGVEKMRWGAKFERDMRDVLQRSVRSASGTGL